MRSSVHADPCTPLELAPHLAWRARHAIGDDLIARIFPVIERVARDLARGSGLDAAATAAISARPELADFFAFDPAQHRFGLRQDLLFPHADPISAVELLAGVPDGECRTPVFTVPEDLDRPAVRAVVRACASGTVPHAEARDTLSPEARSVLDGLVSAGMAVPARSVTPSARIPTHPSIVRLQHAALLFRGRHAAVVVDPHFASAYEPTTVRTTVRYRDVAPAIDAVLISHSHSDHFDTTSLMAFPPDTPIVVPHVPRPSLLCMDMAATLRSLGFTNVHDPSWHSTMTFGDVEVTVLPFFGEQPLRHEAPRDPALRSWGNTYLVRTAGYSAWCLVDSGADHLGDMEALARRVRSDHGPIDVVMSNLRPFYVGTQRGAPEYVAGGHYWLALSEEQIVRFHLLGDELITLGPAGVAGVCQAVDARFALPYAHWWNDLGAPDALELGLAQQLERELERDRTEVVRWTIGDVFGCDGRSPKISRAFF